MKITGQNPPRTGELANTKAREAESKPGSAAGRKPEVAAGGPTRASLTMTKVKDAIRNEPDVRADKVAHVRERIRKGDYAVDTDRLAANMIDSSLHEDLERP
jgi:flagellar biosynthesis anti-sigma factor FlgM